MIRFSFSTTADFCINEIADKLGDAKNKGAAAEALTAITESVKLDHVVNGVTDYALSQNNPKVLQEVLNWLSGAIKEFGFG